MTKIEKLSDAITGERAEYIVPIALFAKDAVSDHAHFEFIAV